MIKALLPSVQLCSIFQLPKQLGEEGTLQGLELCGKQQWTAKEPETAVTGKSSQGKHCHTWKVFNPQCSCQVGIKRPWSSRNSLTSTPKTFRLWKKRFVCFYLPRMPKEEPPWEVSLLVHIPWIEGLMEVLLAACQDTPMCSGGKWEQENPCVLQIPGSSKSKSNPCVHELQLLYPPNSTSGSSKSKPGSLQALGPSAPAPVSSKSSLCVPQIQPIPSKFKP